MTGMGGGRNRRAVAPYVEEKEQMERNCRRKVAVVRFSLPVSDSGNEAAAGRNAQTEIRVATGTVVVVVCTTNTRDPGRSFDRNGQPFSFDLFLSFFVLCGLNNESAHVKLSLFFLMLMQSNPPTFVFSSFIFFSFLF